MSLINKPVKTKKTEDMNKYMKDYRENNLEHFHNLEKTKYYKKRYNLDEEFLTKFGEHSGNVYKLITSFNTIKEIEPELIPHILDILQKNK